MPERAKIETDLIEHGILLVAGRREPVRYRISVNVGSGEAASGRLNGATGLLTAAKMMPKAVLQMNDGTLIEIVLTDMQFGAQAAADFTVPQP
jgi:hypothetical protein